MRISATILVLGTVGYWLAAGANCGWTKTDVPSKTVDQITGLEHIEWRKRFVPGIDFLGGALAATAMLTGVSAIVGKSTGR